MPTFKLFPKKKKETEQTGSVVPTDLPVGSPQPLIIKNPGVSVNQPVQPAPPQVIRDAETGRLTGITTPSGQTLLGLSQREIRNLAASFSEKVSTPAGSIEAGQVAQQRQKQEAGAQLAQQAGQIPPSLLANIQASPLSAEQTIGEAATGVLPSVLQGAIGGAVVGGAGGAVVGGIGAVPGAVIGAVVGGIGGFVSGIRSSIKGQLQGEISAKSISLERVQTNLQAIVADTNANPQNALNNLELFNQQLALMERNHQQLILETNRNVNQWLGADATAELRRYENFVAPGGNREILIQRMQAALINPDPNKATLLSLEDFNVINNEVQND